MRKTFLLFMMIALSLSACTLPQISAPSPTANSIATQVTQKLTQAATTTINPATPIATKLTSPSPTSAVTISPTAVSTATPAPTITLAATTQTPTSGPSATATYEPGDPRIGLGSATLKDTFQKPATWGLVSPYDDGHTRVSITPGKIILTSLEGNNWHGWRMYNATVQNFYLEAVVQTGTCAGADLYGLIFRSPDRSKGYWFGVTCDGHYTLEAGDISNLTGIIKSKTSPLIKSGSNQTNRLGVMVNGNKISLYANSKLLENVTSDAFSGSGVFGYFIAGVKTANFTFESTELSYWKLP